MRNRSAAVLATAPTHPDRRGYALAQVNRPTERQAIRQATSVPAPKPDLLALFESILTAHATGDRHGLSLMGHAVARIATSGKGGAAR